MTFTINNIKEIFKKLKSEDYIYIGIIIFFLIAMIIVFSMTVKFISKNINKVFYSENNNEVGGLNMEQYLLMAKKLNINITNTNTENTPAQATAILPLISTTTTSTTISLDKQSLLIKILNGTTNKGVATTLAKSITDEGFTVLKTGNEKSDYATTTLIMQENKSAYTEILLRALRKSYPQAIATTTNKVNAFDAIIIIGNK